MKAGDWAMTESGNIRYVGSGTTTTYATVVEVHRWMQDLVEPRTLRFVNVDGEWLDTA